MQTKKGDKAEKSGRVGPSRSLTLSWNLSPTLRRDVDTGGRSDVGSEPLHRPCCTESGTVVERCTEKTSGIGRPFHGPGGRTLGVPRSST